MTNTANAVPLNRFLDDWGEPLAERVLKIIRPIHNPLAPDQTAINFDKRLRLLPHKRKPYPAQAEVIKALAKAFFIENKKGLFLLGECGIGKTLISIATVTMGKSNPKVVILCPPQLPQKWCKEIKDTLPHAEVTHLTGRNIISTLAAISTNKRRSVNHPRFFVIGREKAKLSYFWKGAFIKRKVEDGQRTAIYLYCPQCGTRLTDIEKEGNNEYIIPLSEQDLRKKRRKCTTAVAQRIFQIKNGQRILKYRRAPLSYIVNDQNGESAELIACNSPVWTADPKLHRLSPVEYIKKHLKYFFDFAIFDEVHELAAESSLQGNTFGRLASSAKKTLALSGSPSNGYASSLFHTLYRMDPQRLKQAGFEYGKEQEWSQQYGVIETILYLDSEDLKTGRGRSQNKIVRRRPGISPLVLANYLLDKSAFIKLADVHEGLPHYDEQVITLEMHPEQKNKYKDLEKTLKDEITACGPKPPMRLLSKMLQTLLCYPDSCVIRPEEIITFDENGDEQIIFAPKLDHNITLPKESRLVEIVNEQRARGRRVLIYCTFTDSRDVTTRVQEKLEEAGFSVAVLRSNIKPEKRIQWFQAQVDSAIDVVICNPELVKTGLDLLWFPSIIHYQCGYNLNTLRQSSRRSWRIGQKNPVEVFFFTYQETLQEQALHLMAKKLETALLLEGEIPEEGLSAFSDTEEGSMIEDLAKSLTTGSIKGSAEEAWNRLRKRVVSISQTVENTQSSGNPSDNNKLQLIENQSKNDTRISTTEQTYKLPPFCKIIKAEIIEPSNKKKEKRKIIDFDCDTSNEDSEHKSNGTTIQFVLF
jgi:SNF2 family DNA or RNA helicase